MRYIKITDYVKNLTREEIDWFDDFISGGFENQQRPDLERGLLLYAIAKKLNAKRCLDIGTAGFFSARAMAKWCFTDTIDIIGEMPKKPFKNITFIKGKSQDIVPKLDKYDVCFIDGDHFYEGVKQDIQNCKDKCRIIVCHDYGNEKWVTKAIDEELNNFILILEDRMWFGAPYENGQDKNGNDIDYGVVVYDKNNLLGDEL